MPAPREGSQMAKTVIVQSTQMGMKTLSLVRESQIRYILLHSLTMKKGKRTVHIYPQASRAECERECSLH